MNNIPDSREITIEDFLVLPAEPLVSICCFTYKQEMYIRDAVEGFLMQKTNFPIEILIHDDASVDGTADIIRNYQRENPELIRAVYQTENQFSQGKQVPPILYKLARGKYIALCEGDDFWTDPLKLQKQVDFMEAHPECSISGHKVIYRYEGDPEKNHIFPDLDGNKIFCKKEMYGKYISPTCSVVFKRQKIDELTRYLEGFKVGDLPLYYFYWQLGNFGFIDEVMATYRIYSGSYWSLRDESERIPDLFNIFINIKKRLKIRGVNGLGSSIIYYALQLLQDYYKKNEYQKMREIVKRSFNSLNSANKKQAREFERLSLIAFFPKAYKLFRSRKTNYPGSMRSM